MEDDPLLGQQLGAYMIQSKLGQGGMARVYKAHHARLHRDAALKVILPHIASQTEFRAMFEREARVIANLEHSNIVKVYDFGEERNYTYLAMQYLSRGTLRDHLCGGHAIELPRALRYTIQVAHALHYAHLRNIVHCDVKPQNMLISGSAAEQVLLSDFGIARLLDARKRQIFPNQTQEAISNFSHAADSHIEGTAEYMAPEQILQRPVDARTDIYSLGVVLYYMLAGQLPFSATHATGLMYQHVYTQPPPIRMTNPLIPEALALIVKQAMEKQPEARFQSAEQMAIALEKAIAFSTSPTHNSAPPGPRVAQVTGIVTSLSLQPTLLEQSHPCPNCRILNDQANTFCYQCGYFLRTVRTSDEHTFTPFIIEKNILSQPSPPENNPTSFTIQGEIPPSEDVINHPTVRFSVPTQESVHQESLPVKTCPFCQSRLQSSGIFCTNCGRRIALNNPSPHPESGQQNKHDLAQVDPAEDRGSPLIGSLLIPKSSLLPSISAPNVPPASQDDALVDQSPRSFDSSEMPAERNKTPTQTHITRLLEEGNTHFHAQRYEEALAAYQHALDIHAGNAIIHANKGKVLQELGRYEEALKAYINAINLSPHEGEFWTARAYLHSKLEQYNDVLNACERALLLNSQNVLAHSYKGNALNKLKSYEEALTAYEMVLIYTPNDANAWTAKGYILYRQKQNKKALAAYERAATLEPNNASILINKGHVLARLKDYTGALNAYDQATRLKPDEITFWQVKGTMLLKRKQYDQALDAYNHILELTPQDGAVLGVKGNVLSALECYQEALDVYEQALKLLPKRGSIWAAKGKALEKLERYEEALTAFEYAHVLKPDDETIRDHYHLRRDHYDLLHVLKKRQHEEHESPTRQTELPIIGQDEHRPPPTSPVAQQPGSLTPPPIAEDHFNVFLSYSDEHKEDAVWVEGLARRLSDEHGFNVWLDKWMLIPGRSWQPERARGLEQANCCAVCIGEHTSRSWSQQEVQMALTRQQKNPTFRVFAIILPNASSVHIEEYDFLKLNTLVDFRKEDSEWAFHVVVCGVKGIAPGKGPGKEQSTQITNIKTELKLKELRLLKLQGLVDDPIALELQRTVLEKYWLD